MSTTLYIKNMVCSRCIRVVREEFESLGYSVLDIDLGRVTTREKPNLRAVDAVLLKNGFERLQDRKSRLIEEIKKVIRETLYSSESEGKRTNLTTMLRARVNADYNYLSSLFSGTEGITIEKYYILQKIERVKELLKYDELTLSEIAYRLGYSSVAHLSAQFKKTTGLTPTAFSKLLTSARAPIDRVGES